MNRRNLPTRRGWRVAILCGVVAALGAGAGPDDPKAAEPTAEGVLRQAGDYYKGKAFRVRMERETRVGPIVIPNVVNVAVERPNKLAIRTEGPGPGGMDLISDGKTMTLTIAPLKKYVQNLAPESVSALFDEPVTQGILLNSLQGSMVAELIVDDPYKALMEGVTSSTYAGTDDVSGGKAHHLKFTQDQFDWEVWVAAEGDPLLLKASMDLAKTLANNPDAQKQLKGQKYEVVHLFKSWKIGGPVPAKAFAFDPPAGMEKADSLEEALGGAAGANPPGDDDRPREKTRDRAKPKADDPN